MKWFRVIYIEKMYGSQDKIATENDGNLNENVMGGIKIFHQ